MKTFKKYVPWLIVLIWMGIIFYFSSQPAHVSNDLSKGVTEQLMRWLEGYGIILRNHKVRKYAHFLVFLGLGFLMSFAMRNSRYTPFERVARVFVFCVGYAIFDETHQLFVPGRGAQVTDVLIDSMGASVGIGIWMLLEYFKKIITRFHRSNRL